MLGKELIFQKAIFKWFGIKFHYTRLDGTDSGEVNQFVIDRGDSVAMLLHEVEKDEVILVEQLRIATAESGNGWLLELPAGRVDPGEEPTQTALREAREETGAEPREIRLISSFFLSPGGSSERLHLFYCPFHNGIEIQSIAGLKEENEDISVQRYPLKEALEMIETGKIADAKTIIGLLWLNQDVKS